LRQHSSVSSQTQPTNDTHFETRMKSWWPLDRDHMSGLASKQNHSRDSHTRSKSIPIIDPDTNTQIIIPSPKNNDQNLNLSIQAPNNLNLGTLGINNNMMDEALPPRLEQELTQEKNFNETEELPNGFVNVRSKQLDLLFKRNFYTNADSPSLPKPFQCSTPTADVTGNPRFIPRGRLGSATSTLSLKSGRTGTRPKEGDILLQRIKARLVGLEEEGADVVIGLGKMKIGVEELLKEARGAVKELDSMADKLSGYSAVSQQLVKVEDEITLLSATLSQWFNSTLGSGELGVDSIHINDSDFEIEKALNVKTLEETHENKEDFIPILSIMNETETSKSNINDIERTTVNSLPAPADHKISNKEHEIFNYKAYTEELNRKMIRPQIEGPKIDNEKPESLYYSPLQIKKLQNINNPISGELKLKLKAHKIYRTENKLLERVPEFNSASTLTTQASISKDLVHYSRSLDKIDNLLENNEKHLTLENKENKSTEQEDITKKNNEMIGDIEILESSVLSSEETLNETVEISGHSAVKEFKFIEKDEISEKIIKNKTESIVASPQEKIISQLDGVENCETLWSPSVTTIESIAKGLNKLDSGYKGNFIFTEGCPSLFWIHLDTPSLTDLQTHLESVYKHGEGDGGGLGIGVGSEVLAEFSIDGKIYRARVEEVISEEAKAEDCMYCVRYSDYGNSEIVTGKEIHSLDRELRHIPSQAVSCCLVDAPSHWKHKTWTSDQMDVFYQIVDQRSGQLTVELRTKLREPKSLNFLEPMFEALVFHGGDNVIETLRKHRSFANDFRLPLDTNASKNSKSLDAATHVDPANPPLVFPSPEVLPASPRQPGSPLPFGFVEKAKSKCLDWLRFKCEEGDTTLTSQVSSVKSYRAKLSPNSTLQSKEMSFHSSVHVLPLADEIVNFLPSEEESLKTPPLSIGSRKILMDENCSFVYTMSSLEHPGKFYILPIQEEAPSLNQIHQEILRHHLSTPDEHLVIPGSVWCLFSQFKQKWYRVRVESRSSCGVSVRLVDDGTSQEGVGFESLRRLPNTWVSRLPGLAVQSHLVGCNPAREVWHPKSTAKLEKILGYSNLHRAIAVGEENSSYGLVLLVEGEVLNQQMVEWGFAVSQFMDMFDQFAEATSTPSMQQNANK